MRVLEQASDHIKFEMHDHVAFDVLRKIGSLAYHISEESPGLAALGRKTGADLEDELTQCVFPDHSATMQGPAVLDIDYLQGKKVKALISEVAKHQTEPKRIYIFHTARFDEAHKEGAGKEIFDSVYKQMVQ